MEAVKGIYHPDKLDAQTFIDNFTIRLKEFAGIIDNLKKQKKKPLQHFLITGKRGMGKSTLLRRIYLEAKKEPLSNQLITVRLGTEQYKLSRLYKLWEEVIKALSLEDNSLNEKREQLAHDKNYEEHIIHIIVDCLQQKNKTLLLLIDNFDQFIEKLTSKEQHAFREILIQYPIQIIGNTVFYNEHFFRYEKAFFDFFKPIHLRNLDKDEAEEFIKQLAANEGIENFDDIVKNQKAKIETLRILSGGVPRTLVILLSILSKRNTGDAIDYLNEMLEQVTPLYQDRMKALSSQQQEIMHHLAIHWDRTSAKDLAAETRIPSKSISAQLAQLEDSGYINKISTSKRNHLYEIDERFFNIWLLMSESSAYDAKRVIWLTKWLDMFYDNKELEDFVSYCNSSLKQTKPANRFLIMQALSESEKLSWKLRDQLVNDTAKELSNTIPEIKEWELNYNKKRVAETDILDNEISEAIANKNYVVALNKLEKFKDVDEERAYFGIGLVYFEQKEYDKAEQYYLMAAEKGSHDAFNNLGVIHDTILKDYDNAEKYYLSAVEMGDTNSIFNLAHLYKDVKKDYDKAEHYYLMAIEKGDEQVTYFNLAILYEELKKIDKAKQYYILAIKENDDKAMNNLALIYDEIEKDYDKAEQYYLMAVEKGNNKAMNNLALLYDEIKRDFNKAEQYYLMAVENGNDEAINNLASIYERNENYDKAEHYYLMSAMKGNGNSMYNLALIYDDIRKDYDKAEHYYLKAVENNDIDAIFALGFFYKNVRKDYIKAEQYYTMAVERGDAKAMNNLALLNIESKKDYENAEKYYLMSVEQGNDSAMNNLAFFYENIKSDYAQAEKYYLMAVNKGSVVAINNLATLYYNTNNNESKTAALDLVSKMEIESNNSIFFTTKIEVFLWNGKIKEAYSIFEKLLQEFMNDNASNSAISNALTCFLIFKQKQFLYKLFAEKDTLLRDKFKPLYFALLQEMKNELPDEYLKMTEELVEPVNDLLSFVREERKRLGVN